MSDFGLIEKGGNSPLPLRSLAVEGDIKGYILGLTIKLIYDNTNTGPVEVIFKMPVEDSSVLVGLTAIIDGRKIRAELKEKEEAKIVYDDAIASGLPAALGQENTKDIFSISLGNLAAGSKAEIHLDLVGQLPIDAEKKLSFTLPTFIKARYTPPGLTSDNSDTSSAAGYGITGLLEGVAQFVLRIHYASSISDVTSDTHTINVENDSKNDTKIVTLADSALLNRDIVIQISPIEPHTPLAIVERGEGKDGFMSDHVIMVNFLPLIPHKDIICEFIFLVDRSGSMSGQYIKSASETLILFLKSLPEGCYFNIYGFGSRYVSLFDSSVPYNQENLEKAIGHAQTLKADLGGTEILPPLQKIYKQPLVEGLPRQIFLLTDGSVSNTNDCIREVRNNVQIAKCFTFGIGSGASSALVNGMAAAGKGTAEFVKEGERLQPKVIRSLKHAMQPVLTDVSIEFHPKNGTLEYHIPNTLPAVYDGDRLVMYGVVKSSGLIEGNVTLSGVISGEPATSVSHTIAFKEREGENTKIIHRLAAKVCLVEMEKENKPKDDIVKLSVESSVVSKETAFIAVDEETSVPINEPLTVYKSQVEDISSQLNSVHYLMATNIDCAISRGENLDSLQLQSACLSDEAMSFQKSASRKKGGGFLSGIGSAITNAFSWGSSSSVSAPAPQPKSSSKGKRNNVEREKKMALSIEDMEAKEEEISVSRKRRSSIEMDRSERGDTPSPEELSTPPQLPAAVPPTAAIKKPIDLSSIIILQQANGSWLLSEGLASFLNSTVDILKDGCPSGCPSPEVWATVLVVTILKSQYIAQKDEWELVVKKAEGWLKGQTEQLDTLYEEAKKFI